ncbi:MAG: hypothetical protein JHC33_03385 [Ignisphaera sp.]|nr:hypothetical protein [Ignisphaera sp.]
MNLFNPPHQYNSFEYIGDLKRALFESRTFSVAMRLPYNHECLAADHEAMARGQAVRVLTESLYKHLDVTFRDDIRGMTTEVIYSIRVLEDRSRERYEDSIEALDNQLKKTHSRVEQLKDLNHNYFLQIKGLEEIIFDLQKPYKFSFMERIKVFFYGTL